MKKSILYALIALFVLGGTFVYLYHQNSIKSQDIEQYEQNWKATNDSLEQYKLSNGQLLAERESFILAERELRAKLGLSETESKELKKKLGSALATITDLKANVRVDTILLTSVPDTIAPDSICSIFIYKDDWLALDGSTTFTPSRSFTSLNNIEMSVPLRVGMTEQGKTWVTTPNPYINFTEVTGIINERVVPRKKHWGIGINVGPGLYYDFRSKDIGYGIGAQIGINYNF